MPVMTPDEFVATLAEAPTDDLEDMALWLAERPEVVAFIIMMDDDIPDPGSKFIQLVRRVYEVQQLAAATPAEMEPKIVVEATDEDGTSIHLVDPPR